MVKITKTVISGDVARVGHGGHRPELRKMAGPSLSFAWKHFQPSVR
jgi:hypothetical protein